ncbi:MAG: hypothetical protein MUP17_12640 [candidate division Zixibacteria bacterium]|nr:hypothetical protein [candidate division Zixibacteria bacterium]
MNHSGNESLEKMHTKILQLGMVMDIFLPLVIFFLAVYLRDRLIQVQTVKNLDLFFYVLLAVSLSEVVAIFIIKRQFSARFMQKNVGQGFSPAQEGPDVNTRQPFDRNLLSFGTVIFALCFSPTIYGLVYYLLGGTWEHFALFVAITFIFFQLFKPKMEELEKLTRDLDIG